MSIAKFTIERLKTTAALSKKEMGATLKAVLLELKAVSAFTFKQKPEVKPVGVTTVIIPKIQRRQPFTRICLTTNQGARRPLAYVRSTE
jgi:hypothetical protein